MNHAFITLFKYLNISVSLMAASTGLGPEGLGSKPSPVARGPGLPGKARLERRVVVPTVPP